MHTIFLFLSLNIFYVIYGLLWITCWLMWFESLLVFILLKFKKSPNISGIQVSDQIISIKNPMILELTTFKPVRLTAAERFHIPPSSSLITHIVILCASQSEWEKSWPGSGGINYSDYSIKCRPSLFSAYTIKYPLVDSWFVMYECGFYGNQNGTNLHFYVVGFWIGVQSNPLYYYVKQSFAKIRVLSLYLNGKCNK